jgi:multidrug efflux pump subunit AcrB
MGKFIYVIPLVVIFALTLSFIEVTIALPAHLAGLDEKPLGQALFDKIEKWCEGFLNKVLKLRYLVVVVFLVVLLGSIYFVTTQMSFIALR